jgi:hypothetical protein
VSALSFAYCDGLLTLKGTPSTQQDYDILKTMIREVFNLDVDPPKITILSLTLLGSASEME